MREIFICIVTFFVGLVIGLSLSEAVSYDRQPVLPSPAKPAPIKRTKMAIRKKVRSTP